MADVSFNGVTKRYDGLVAVDHLDLTAADGELLVLLGPSGCGKTTALRMVAGLEEITEGTIAIGGRIVNDIDPRQRDVAMVFQSYALYPHLTVAANIQFPLRQRKLSKAERAERTAQAARTLGLDQLLDRKPGQLSGGQRQRVALARAIVREPQVFLMDEPLSNLDAALRLHTRADIVALQRRLGTTTVYVTHDQVEAMTMAHRIAVLEGGRLQQVARPKELYDRPANRFVAEFLGSPGMNMVPGAVERQAGGDLVAVTAAGRVPLGPPSGDGPGDAVREIALGIRPEHLHLDPAGSLGATVTLVELLGAEVHVVCDVGEGHTVVVRQSAAGVLPTLGETVRIAVEPGQAQVFAGDDGRRVEVLA